MRHEKTATTPGSAAPVHEATPAAAASPTAPDCCADAGWTLAAFLLAALVFGVALAIRYAYVHQSAANPTFEHPIVDAEVYDRMARRVVSGEGLKDFFWQPVFYPLFLAVVYFFSDSSIFWAKVAQAVLGAFTCALTYRLTERTFGRRTGVLAGLMAAGYGPLVFYEAELVGSGWGAFWSVALVCLFLRAARGKSPQVSFWLGVCGVLAILTRPTFGVFFVAGCFWLVAKFVTDASRWGALAKCLPALVAGILLVYLPTARLSQRVTGRFGIMPYSGGINFYIGNNPDTCATLTIRPGIRWTELTQLPERHGIAPDDGKKQEYFYKLVREYVRDHPAAYLAGLGRKVVRFLNSRELPRNEDVYVFSRWSSLMQALTWKVGGFGFPFGVLLPLAAVGLLWNLRRIPGPVILALLLLPAAIVLVFVAARYRVEVIPLTVILAAAGCASLLGHVQRRAWNRLAISAGVMAALGLLATIPGPFCEEQPNYEAELYYCLGASAAADHRVDEAIAHYRRTLELDPDFADACNNLGAEYYDRGQLPEAIHYFGRAAELWPDNPTAHFNLAAANFKLGRIDEAERCWENVLALNPRDFNTHYLLGNALLNEGKTEAAAERYAEAVRLRPNFRLAVGNYGVALQRLGRFDEALAQYRRAVDLDPNDAIARDNLLKLLVTLEEYDEAVRQGEAALQRAPNNAEWRYQYGRALEGLGRLDDAAARYREALQLNPAHADARARLQALTQP